jgi:hypothetical protein
MKKKVFCGIAAYVIIAAVAAWNVSVNFSSQKNELSDISLANVVALADNENGYGWLWEKHWVSCQIGGQIIVHSSGGSISAGTYVYSVALEAALSNSYYSFTVIPAGSGQKSYCYDGWSFCWSNDCR